jgi:cytochrome c-type biogenesis protein CcmH/NrfG
MVVLPGGNVQQQCEWYGATRGKSSGFVEQSTVEPVAYIRTMTEPQASTTSTSESLTDPLPALERAVAQHPDDAKGLVALANHYWLIGAGPEAVGDLASRAIASDPDNRAAWHLWALSESDPRLRVTRWQQVSARFPLDELAKANLADNAASLAGAEHDYQAVDLAIETYEDLLSTAQQPDQRRALEKAIKTLKGWKF